MGSGDDVAMTAAMLTGSLPAMLTGSLPAVGTAAFYAFACVYDMEAVPHSDVNPADYYTVSSAGVTRFHGSRSNFTPLEQWEREYRLYHALRRVPLFAQYRTWKGFAVWRNAVVKGKRASACKALSENLFLLNPPLRAALLRLRRLCAEVRGWTLFTCDHSKTYTLEAFVAAQAERRVVVTTWLTQFSTDVRGLIRLACDQVLDAFLADNKIEPQHKMTFMERASLRGACKRLRRFIKVADFLIRDTLVGLALDSAATLVSYILPPPDRLPPHAVRTELPPDAEEQAAAAAAAAAANPLGGLYSAGSLAHTLSALTAASSIKLGGGAGGAVGGKGGADVSGGRPGQPVPLLEIVASFELDGSAPSSSSGDARARSSSKGGKKQSQQHRGADRRNSGPDPPHIASASALAAGTAASTDVTVSQLLVDSADVTLPYIELSPSLAEVKSALRTVLFDSMVVISVPPRLLTHPDLAPYTKAAADDSGGDGSGDGGDGGEGSGGGDDDVDLTEAVTTHTSYRRLPLEMMSGLEDAFSSVEEFCAVFLPYIATFMHGQRTLAAMERPSYAADVEALPPAQFERAIAAYRAQQARLEAAPASADVGVLRVDSVQLKRRLLPTPDKCLRGLQGHIPSVLSSLTDALTDDARTMYGVLASNPSEVSAFLCKMTELERSNEAIPAFRERETHIRTLATTMASNGWPIGDDVKARFKMLRDALADLEAAAQKADTALEDDAKRFARTVEAMVPVLRKALISLRERLDDGQISDASATPARVVRFLREQQMKLSELTEQAQRIGGWQTALKQLPATFETVPEVTSDLDAKLALWDGLCQWEALTSELEGQQFTALDLPVLTSRLAAFSDLASRSEKAVPGNAAVAKLRAAVELYRCLLPLVAHLRSPCLARRHWDELCLLLHISPPPRTLSGMSTHTASSSGGAATPGGAGTSASGGSSAAGGLGTLGASGRGLGSSTRDLFASAGGGGGSGAGSAVASASGGSAVLRRSGSGLHLPVSGAPGSAASMSAATAAVAATSAGGGVQVPAITIRGLLDANVTAGPIANAIATIAAEAAAEAELAATFASAVTSVWAGLDLPVAPYKGSKDLVTLQPPDVIISALERSGGTIASLLASPHCGPIRAEVEGTKRRLALLSDTLCQWLGVQSLWLQLEPVFASEDAQRQLPEDGKRFAAVDRAWKALMKRTGNNPNALTCCNVKGLREALARHAESLQSVAQAASQLLQATCSEIAGALGRSKAGPEDRARAEERVLPVLRLDVEARLVQLGEQWGLEHLLLTTSSLSSAVTADAVQADNAAEHDATASTPAAAGQGGSPHSETDIASTTSTYDPTAMSSTAAAAAGQLASFLPEARALALQHQQAAASVVDDVPPPLMLGLAYIHVSEVRSALARKHTAVANGILQMVADAATALVAEALQRQPRVQMALASGEPLETLSALAASEAASLGVIQSAFSVLEECGYVLSWPCATAKQTASGVLPSSLQSLQQALKAFDS